MENKLGIIMTLKKRNQPSRFNQGMRLKDQKGEFSSVFNCKRSTKISSKPNIIKKNIKGPKFHR